MNIAMKKMKAIVATAYGGPDVLEVTEVRKPLPKAHEVLIKIDATSITAAGATMRKGTPFIGRIFTGLIKPNIRIPGTDLAGTIEAVGESVTRFEIGDKVMAETDMNFGSYAEYICMPEDSLIVHKPENMSSEQATGVLDGACTALGFLNDLIQLKKGQKVLINGASGSIGSAAIQLCKFYGTDVTGVTSTKNKALVKDIGADHVLDYTKNELEKSTEKFDVLFDTVGTLTYSKAKKHLKPNGICLTPVLHFSTFLNLIFVSPLSKRKLKFYATGLRNKEKRMKDLKLVQELLKQNKLIPVLDRVYLFHQIQSAHRYVDTGRKRGNVVLKVNI